MSNPASMSIGDPLTGAFRCARPKQREPPQLGARSSLERKRMWRVCVPGGMDGTGLAGLISRPVRRVAAREDKTPRVYLGHYDMDHSTSEQRAAFLQKVRRTFETW